MKICPPTITILSFLFIAVGIISTGFRVWQFNVVRPTFLEQLYILIVGVLAVVAGVYMMRGRNWARWLAIGWLSFHVVVSAFYELRALAFHLVFVALLAWLLFRRESQEWFMSAPKAAEPPVPTDLPPAS
jgi:hypothetical protein